MRKLHVWRTKYWQSRCYYTYHEIGYLKCWKCQAKKLSVLYPEVFWGGRFFNECSEEKNGIAAGVSGGAVSPPQWGPGAKSWKILAI